VSKKKDLSRINQEVWDNYIKDPSDVYDKEKNNVSSAQAKNRFRFDLHGLSLDEANSKVREIILYCSKNKYKELLLITGKGNHSTNDQDIYVSKNFGKLKYSVPEFIKSNEDLNKLILSINEADVKNGGEGAILIKLKKL
tara:strand:- start:70 stop:489 length:420 start_codon:yes stop_codon:yes gene_type:complete